MLESRAEEANIRSEMALGLAFLLSSWHTAILSSSPNRSLHKTLMQPCTGLGHLSWGKLWEEGFARIGGRKQSQPGWG